MNTASCPPAACTHCSVRHPASLKKLGLEADGSDFVIGLAGNPNVGKSTVFNHLTGLRQHTGNWPGKTVARAEGGYGFRDRRYRLIDLPGTYSLLSTSVDEQIARDCILFGRLDVTVIVADATQLERNLNLTLQILEITDRAVLCLNLMDEARAHGIAIDLRALSRDLGIPVIGCSARRHEGMAELLDAIHEVATGAFVCRPRRLPWAQAGLSRAIQEVTERLRGMHPEVAQAEWVAHRLLAGDTAMIEAVRSGELDLLGAPAAEGTPSTLNAEDRTQPTAELLHRIEALRWEIPPDSHDRLVESIYGESATLAARHVRIGDQPSKRHWQTQLDWLLTSRLTGLPILLFLFAAVLWLTITGANVPSALLADLLLGQIHPWLRETGLALGLSPWINGLLVDGMYLSAAWVVSVMLPPMAIFFPAFTLLEDFGYLPRVAFNLDRFFQRAGAHGKQALTMAMGFGCNAAGVTAARIIDSPRERLIAIITNNFALCNGRWPTQILIASLFIGALAPPILAGWVATAAVFGVAMLGVILTFVVSWGLSRTVLRGAVSTFSLELPPYRPPSFWRTLYTSLIDRTLFVLWRAVVFAVPAGAAIWLIANVDVGGASIAHWMIHGLEPLAWVLGLTGVILVAYIVAIPANEIVVPAILMLTVLVTGTSGGVGAGVMFEAEDSVVRSILVAGGWTPLTAVCLMLFSLCHNPCSTTLYTIQKETGNWRWTALAAIVPLVIGTVLCASVAAVWRFFS